MNNPCLTRCKLLSIPLIFSYLISLPFGAVAKDDALKNIAERNNDSGIPAILNYVQQQDAQSRVTEPQSKPAISYRVTKPLHTKLNAQQTLLTKKDGIIRQLQNQLDQLKKQRSEEKAQASSQLTEQLAEARKSLADRHLQLSDTMSQLVHANGQLKDAQQQLTTQETTLAEKGRQLNELKTKVASYEAKPDLTKPEMQQAYSIGVALGEDVLHELAAHDVQGLTIDRPTVLRGIADLFAGHPELDEETRSKAVTDASQALYEKMNKLEKQARDEGKAYQQKFAEQKGVEFKEGVYSRIDYQGQEPIKPDDKVSVVMKETLPDGTVISDMEAKGKVWSQPLSAFPPVFKGPLMRLGNHGSLTLVVPPELAYGSKGLPPKIPPGATMTYSIRIVDVNK